MTTTSTDTRALSMTRRFDTPPERVFDAWTRADIARRWLFTSTASEANETAIDARVGGKWSIKDRREGVDYFAHGEFLEVLRPHRLVFSFGMPQFSDASDTVTVDIRPDGTGCVITLTQQNAPPEHHDALRRGWSEMFENLARQFD